MSCNSTEGKWVDGRLGRSVHNRYKVGQSQSLHQKSTLKYGIFTYLLNLQLAIFQQEIVKTIMLKLKRLKEFIFNRSWRVLFILLFLVQFNLFFSACDFWIQCMCMLSADRIIGSALFYASKNVRNDVYFPKGIVIGRRKN